MTAEVKRILDYTKQSLENVTGMEVIDIKFRTKCKSENIEKLKEAVCKAYGVTLVNLEKTSRKKDLPRARQMIYYFAIEKYGMGVVEAGRMFGQDHTTAIHSRGKVKDFIDIEDPETLDKIRLINEYLNN